MFMILKNPDGTFNVYFGLALDPNNPPATPNIANATEANLRELISRCLHAIES